MVVGYLVPIQNQYHGADGGDAGGRRDAGKGNSRFVVEPTGIRFQFVGVKNARQRIESGPVV